MTNKLKRAADDARKRVSGYSAKKRKQLSVATRKTIARGGRR